MLVKKLQLLRVLLPDVTREQIKFTLFPDIQLTFLIYFFLVSIHQPILSRVMNIFRLPPKKKKKSKSTVHQKAISAVCSQTKIKAIQEAQL